MVNTIALIALGAFILFAYQQGWFGIIYTTVRDYFRSSPPPAIG